MSTNLAINSKEEACEVYVTKQMHLYMIIEWHLDDLI